MSHAKHIGRVGALAVALGVGMAAVVPVSMASAPSEPCTDTHATCALIIGTSGVPTPDDFYLESVKNQFITPTQGPDVEYVKVTTPEELWPLGGVGRLGSLLGLGSWEVFGPGGPAWDVPWWDFPGLFDLTLNQSVLQGVTDLEGAIAEHPNDRLVIFGYSQSALIANRVKRKLAEQYPAGTEPDIDFVLFGDPNLPNGGFLARFSGLYIPILDWTFNGPAPTDTQFDTVEIIRKYDFMADFPLYPLNFISDLNALLGFFYVHTYPFDVSLADNTSVPTVSTDPSGKTTYYFYDTPDLPLFTPLRMLGVPEPVIDVFEPFFREVVELGYDRSIPLWEPTPARLIPTLDPGTVATDLVNAIGEGVNNAAALFGSPAPLSIPTPVTTDQEAAVDQLALAPESIVETVSRDAVERVSQLLTTVGSPPPQPPAVSQHDTIDEGINHAAAVSGSPPPPSTPAPLTPDQDQTVEQSGTALDTTIKRVRRELAATRDQINDTLGEVNSVLGNGRTVMRSAGSASGFHAATQSHARKTSVHDATAGSDMDKAVAPVPDSINKALSGGKDDDDKGDGGEGGAQ